jgi:PKD repeat protein
VRDGFTVRQDFFGTTGTSNLYNARASTHEIGHYFGLAHPWGSTNTPGSGNCTGTDNVADTPTTDGSSTCNLNYSPCGVLANVQNFMDYSFCFTMFTQGQRTLMRNVLAANCSQLVSQANLLATGTNDGYVATFCAPVAQFAPSVTKVCEGSTVTFRDYSYNFAQGTTPTYSWSFPGGTPATSTSATPTVTYNTSGIYSVTETVTSAGNSGTSTSTNLILVQGATGGETAPLFESFETSAFPDNYPAPSLRNYTDYGTTAAGVVSTSTTSRWRRVASVPVPDGTACLVVTNSSLAASYTATLITPNINLTGITQPILSFQRAYALRSASPTETLIISFSTDCGTTWNNPILYQGSDLTTMGTTPQASFAPSSTADWQTLTIPIPAAYQGAGRFQVKFDMVNGITAANNFFMDALRISSALATHEAALTQRGISVYPNPLTNETAVHVTLKATTQVQVSLTDVVGRQVLSLPAKTYGAGNQTINLQTTGTPLRAGIYVVRIALDGETYSTKLTVN